MSYEIIYDRKFVKTSRGVIPVVLMGSNNCFDVKRDSRGRHIEVAERSWTTLTPKNLLESTAEDLLDNIANAYASYEPTWEFAKFRSKWILNKDVPAWYHAGVCAAKTLEEYICFNPNQALRCYLSIWPKAKDSSRKEELLAILRKTDELEAWIDAAKKRKTELDAENTVYICLGFLDQLPLKSCPKSAKGQVIGKHGRSYLVKYEPGKSAEYDLDVNKAIVFDSREDAITKVGYNWPGLRFINAANAKKPKPFALKTVGGFHSGHFIRQKTARHLYFTETDMYALRFATESAAKKYAEAIAKTYTPQQLGEVQVVRTV